MLTRLSVCHSAMVVFWTSSIFLLHCLASVNTKHIAATECVIGRECVLLASCDKGHTFKWFFHGSPQTDLCEDSHVTCTKQITDGPTISRIYLPSYINAFEGTFTCECTTYNKTIYRVDIYLLGMYINVPALNEVRICY